MFRSIKYDIDKMRFIISPHPLVNIQEIKDYIYRLNIIDCFEYYPEHSTQELVISSDLVVCGYSSVALDLFVSSTNLLGSSTELKRGRGHNKPIHF